MELCEAVPNQCNDDGHLTHLSLSSEGLDCRFPKELSSLKSLTRLDLTFNQMDGRYVTFLDSSTPPSLSCTMQHALKARVPTNSSCMYADCWHPGGW